MPPSSPRIRFPLPLRYQSCVANSQCRRTFTTSSTRLAIGPDSPLYIEIPQPPQPSYPERPRIKGILPVPRDILPATKNKADPTFLEKSAPLPASDAVRTDPANDYKRRLAATRRQNLREGITELHTRQQRTKAIKTERIARKVAERERILALPEPEDERLTRQTVPKAVRYLLGRAGQEVPRSAEEIAESRRRYAEREAERSRARVDALHALYMRARSFITTEADLMKAVDEAFGKDQPATFGQVQGAGDKSVWHHGRPDSIQRRLNAMEPRFAINFGGDHPNTVAEQRLKRVVEEMTGGKT